MTEYVKRFSEYLKKRQVPFSVIHDQIFWSYQRMIVPLGPVQQNYSLLPGDVKVLFKVVPGFMIRWNNSEAEPGSSWYAVISDHFTPMEKMPSKLRSQFKKGIEHCEVRKIDFKQIKEQIFDVYLKANLSYKRKSNKLLGFDAFNNHLDSFSGFEDIVHFWGVFYKDLLIGYSEVFVYDKEEANISIVKINPEYKHFFPSYALFYKICEFYLEVEKFGCVSDGYKSLLHDSNVQEFLIKKLSFKMIPLKMFRVYKAPLSYMIKTCSLFFWLIPNQKIKALFKMEQIYINQKGS